MSIIFIIVLLIIYLTLVALVIILKSGGARDYIKNINYAYYIFISLSLFTIRPILYELSGYKGDILTIYNFFLGFFSIVCGLIIILNCLSK